MSSFARIRTPLVATLAAILVVTGCAYFNMLYNAKEKYREAEKLPDTPGGEPTRGKITALDGVIEKCQTMIGTYPDSRHVDDAMLLIANCLFLQTRYDETVAELDSLEAKFPETELLPDVRFLKGRAYAEAEKYAEAVVVLSDYTTRWKKHKERAHGLYYLSAGLMQLDRSEEAVIALDELAKKYSGSEYTMLAQVEVGAILADKGLYEESLAVYERLNSERLPIDYRYDVWMGLARVYIALGQADRALDVIKDVQTLALGPRLEPQVLILKGKAFADVDSVQRSINAYEDVTRRFSRGEYAATAHFRLGETYEAMDSLETAKRHFEAVPRAFANSEYSSESIKRAGNITKLMRLAETEGSDDPAALAYRAFSMGELQLLQFNNTDKALASYQEVLTKYPDSEYGPKAAYAVAYIYGVVLGDTLKARESYDLLRARYPGTQQAVNADQVLLASGMSVPPRREGVMVDEFNVVPPPRPAAADSLQQADSTAVEVRDE